MALPMCSINGQPIVEPVEPTKGIAVRTGAGCPGVGVGDGVAADQGIQEDAEMKRVVMKRRDLIGKAKMQGMAATGFSASVGTQ